MAGRPEILWPLFGDLGRRGLFHPRQGEQRLGVRHFEGRQVLGLGNLLGLVGLLVGESIAIPDGKGEVDTALGQSCVATLDVFVEIEAANNDTGRSSLAPDLRMRTMPMTRDNRRLVRRKESKVR